MEITISLLSNLRVELYVIGYSEQGESIVFLIYDNIKPNDIIYSGVIDSYAIGNPPQNITTKILEDRGLEHIDVLCWTHPDKDHSVGIETIVEDFCDNKTMVIIPVMLENLIKDGNIKCSTEDRERIDRIFDLNNRLHRNVEPVGFKQKAFSTLEEIEIYDKVGNKVCIQLDGFAPLNSILSDKNHKDMGVDKNDLSVALCLKVGDYKLNFCADIEDTTITKMCTKSFESSTFIKLPHHGSDSSTKLLSCIKNPVNLFVSTTTFKTNHLPKADVIDDYIEISDVVSTTKENDDPANYGYIRYLFDFFGEGSVHIYHEKQAGCIFSKH